MDKPRLNSTYHFIDLDEDWFTYRYATRENIMDQTDRYNIATKNWSYELDDLENRTYDILHILTCKSDEEIAAMMMHHENT